MNQPSLFVLVIFEAHLPGRFAFENLGFFSKKIIEVTAAIENVKKSEDSVADSIEAIKKVVEKEGLNLDRTKTSFSNVKENEKKEEQIAKDKEETEPQKDMDLMKEMQEMKTILSEMMNKTPEKAVRKSKLQLKLEASELNDKVVKKILTKVKTIEGATDDTEKARIRKERFYKIVSYAKQNSPYYKELYKNIGDKFELSDLPPTNKKELMSHFNEWITDQSTKLSDIYEFMKEPDNIGHRLKGDYLVFTTSGSTGNPLVMLCDKNTNNVMGGISASRAFARKQDFKAFLKAGKKTIGVFATGGFYLAYGSVRSRLLTMPWKRKQMAVTSALLPISQIVDELNAFNLPC
jgi:hypothetical protein